MTMETYWREKKAEALANKVFLQNRIKTLEAELKRYKKLLRDTNKSLEYIDQEIALETMTEGPI